MESPRADESASQVSRSSSRLSEARIEAAARSAELAAEAECMRQRQLLEQEELKIKQRLEELKLKAQSDAARAKMSVYDRFLSEGEHVEAPAFEQQHPGFKVVDDDIAFKLQGSPAFTETHQPQADAIRMWLQENQRHQEEVLDVLRLPAMQLSTFDGDPLQYWSFIKAFENVVDSSSASSGAKLMRLLQYCTGKAKRVIECCAVMEPVAGYFKALQLLKERFGDNFQISEAWIRKVTEGPHLKQEEREKLQEFSDELCSCQEILHAAGYEAEVNTQKRIVDIVTRLPNYLQHRWRKEAIEIKTRSRRMPNFGDVVRFVRRAAEEANDPVYGGIGFNKQQQVTQHKRNYKNNFSACVNDNIPEAGVRQQQQRCTACGLGDHPLYRCSEFRKMNPEQRMKLVSDTRLCFNCLNPGHRSFQCHLQRACTVPGCGKRHSNLLHQRVEVIQNGRIVNQSANQSTSTAEPTVQVNNVTGAGPVRVALPVLPVTIRAPGSAKAFEVYALLDSGSTNSFCSESILKQLEINGTEEILDLTTLGNKSKRTKTTVIRLEVFDANGEVHEIPTVYAQPELHISTPQFPKSDVDRWPHLYGIQLHEFQGQKVSLLIGQDMPELLMPKEIRRGEVGAPYAVRTALGWVLNGPLGQVATFGHRASSNFAHGLEQQVERFWKLDAYELLQDETVQLSAEDRKAISIWENSIHLHEGHYRLAIPFKDRPPRLQNNISLAQNRLRTLERRLERNPDLHKMYSKKMEEMIQEGYVERINETESGLEREAIWYLPHHPVFHPRKGSLRIVFDCAAKYNGISINDQVLQGPDLTNQLVGVLLRFRQETVAIMADIKSMFHQVQVMPEDRDALRFLWWPNGNLSSTPATYRMKVHLFGGIWSPSCCSFALRRVAEDNKEKFETETLETVRKNFYVDDCLKSVPCTEDAVQMVKELTTLLAKGGFKLTKWISNDHRVLEWISEEDKAVDAENISLSGEMLTHERALGVLWNTETDCFTFKPSIKESAPTRRGILSTISSVYDPLGFICPCILPAKRFLQQLTRQKISWDEPLPERELEFWISWKNEICQLDKFKLERNLKPKSFKHVDSCQLHHFADASSVGYGVVTYLRVVDLSGNVHCSLVTAKSKLAPLKSVTIPRLELSAACLAVKMDKFLHKELQLKLDESVFWTDSMIALQYIANERKRFHTFVANRVTTIRDWSIPSQWRYVESALNPADDASRGLSVNEFLQSNRWLNGPEFLWKNFVDWPKLISPSSLEISKDDPEVKREVQSFAVGEDISDASSTIERLLVSCSSWFKLKKVVACLLRVKTWLLNKIKGISVECVSRVLTVKELQIAEREVVKLVQRDEFSMELRNLSRQNEESSRGMNLKSSPIFRLNVRLSEEGLLVVGGRLKHSALPTAVKHPMILPKRHHVVNLIIEEFHRQFGHAGKEHVLSLVRKKFWIINARAAVRKVLSECYVCRRKFAAPLSQKMADLPADRVTADHPPFTCVGIDCFGPFMVKNGRVTLKRYGCLFTCLVVRAVHIEIIHSMDTGSFINALQRFMARRGTPKEIRCDNGTNFVGAQKELRKALEQWNQKKIGDFLLQNEIEWKFNPPTASHMGGAWERMIRSTRRILEGLLIEQTLDDERLATLMCTAESVINSRPLTTISDDVRDPEPLTPNHLLLLRAGSPFPLGVFSQEDQYCKRRWKQVQYLADVFWRRWLREYLPSLQKRQKWNDVKRNLEVGDIVLLQEQDTPRNVWPIARVKEVYPGQDGLVRTVKVLSKNKELTRPVQKLVLLETVSKSA